MGLAGKTSLYQQISASTNPALFHADDANAGNICACICIGYKLLLTYPVYSGKYRQNKTVILNATAACAWSK
jgi:hypothetical protein